MRTWSRHGLWAERVGCELWIKQSEGESSLTKLRLWSDVGTMRQEKRQVRRGGLNEALQWDKSNIGPQTSPD